MLREVKNKHIKPRIIPFQATLASTPTVDIGYGDFTVARASTGTGTITPRFGFTRPGLAFLTQQTTTGGYATYNAATASGTSLPFTLLDNAGSVADGTVEGFLFGWDNGDFSLAKQQRVASTQSSPRIIWGKVTGSTGAVAINARDFSCTRSSAGVYAVTFSKAFGKTPVVMITGSGNTSTSVANRSKVTSKIATGCTVTMAPESGTPTDGDFYILAIGSDGRSDSARGRMPLQNSQRKPRIVAGNILMTAGTPTVSIGSATGGADLTTIVDNGAGDFSFTIAESFIREPAIFLTTTTQGAEVHSYSAGVVRCKIKNATGDDTDVNGVTSVFIIGTDVNETF